MNRVPIELSPTERQERVALAVTAGKSNRVIAAELAVDEATARRDRKFLATPLKQRPAKKLKKVRPVREISPKQTHHQRLKELLQLARSWVV
jgi:FixJ family two-component response regulator